MTGYLIDTIIGIYPAAYDYTVRFADAITAFDDIIFIYDDVCPIVSV